MCKIYIKENPLTISIKDKDTSIEYALCFDDVSGTITFKIGENTCEVVEISYFNNIEVRFYLENLKTLDDDDRLTVEYIIFLEKLVKLFTKSGDSAEQFILKQLYLENNCLSTKIIEAFCRVYGYRIDSVESILNKKLSFAMTELPYIDWLVEPVSTLVTPIGVKLEIGKGMFNISRQDGTIFTHVISSNNRATRNLTLADKLVKSSTAESENLYNLAKKVYSHIALMSIGYELCKELNTHKITPNTEKILISQLIRFKDIMLNTMNFN